jgi:transposase
MSKGRRFITGLSQSQLAELESGYKYGANNVFRAHCQAILLSHQGYTVQELMQIFDCRKNTIYDWFNRYQSDGIAGLQIKQGRGRKPKLTADDKAIVEEQVQQNRRKLSLAKAAIEKELGKELSRSTLTRFLKSMVTVGADSVKASKTGKTPRRWKRSRRKSTCWSI